MTKIRALLLTLAVVCLSATAHAEDKKVKWHEDWPRVRWWEGLNIVALTLGSYAIDQYWEPPRSADWSTPILFDKAVRSFISAKDFSGMEFAAKSSDRVYLYATFAPYIIDNYIVALGIHQNADVAVQMTLMNMQSLGITGVLALSLQRGLGRARPYTRDCSPDGKSRNDKGEVLYNECDFGGADYQSFPSGHAGATMTMAGLTCMHHKNMPLYGGGPVEMVPCIVMLTASLYAGGARLVADRHWASDVLVGWGIGAFSGFLLPSLLHYGWGNKRVPLAIEGKLGKAYPTPQAFAGGAGLGLIGTF